MKCTFISSTPKETRKIGQLFGRYLRGAEIVCIHGTIGAGKTALAQGVIVGTGVNCGEFPGSPTFSIVNTYSGQFTLNHIDLYRLTSLEDIVGLGIEDMLFGGEILLIEWADKLERLVPDKRIDIRISIKSETQRSLLFESFENAFSNPSDFERLARLELKRSSS